MAEYRIHINFAALATVLARKLNPVIERIAFGLHAAESAPSAELTLPSFFHIRPSANRDPATISADFRTWLMTSGLRDGIEAVQLFFEDVHVVCAAVDLSQTGQATGKNWKLCVAEPMRRFHKKRLPEKIDHLRKTFQFACGADWERRVLSLNRARNCLVHRFGIVSKEHDLNSADGLRISWRRVDVFATGPTGERPVTAPDRFVEAGEAVGIRFTEAHRLFKPGEKVDFSADEFSELCFTLMTFGQHVAQQLESHAKAHGVAVRDTNASEA